MTAAGFSTASTWQVTMSAPAVAKSASKRSGWSTIRWQCNGRSVIRRIDSTTTGPTDSGGTKWASMASM
jgi:hypothetical protein